MNSLLHNTKESSEKNQSGKSSVRDSTHRKSSSNRRQRTAEKTEVKDNKEPDVKKSKSPRRRKSKEKYEII